MYLIVTGSIFLLLSISMTCKRLNLLKVCTELTTGNLIEFIGNSIYTEYGSKKYYSPVYEFEIYGEKMTYENNLGHSAKKHKNYHLGDTVTIYYNPNNPKQLYVKEDHKSQVNASVMLGIAGLIFVFFGFVYIFLD